MRRFYTFSLAMLMAAAATAQTYSLSGLDETAFEAGGDATWSFEWYDQQTHLYSSYSEFGYGSYANYLDWYNPERLGGQLITEFDDDTNVKGVYTGYVATNLRPAWYNVAYENPEQGTTYERYCYVARDDRDGFGYEIYGNKGRSSVVTFTVPADGWYKVDGQVAREDNAVGQTLVLLPRFRYASATQSDYADAQNVMLGTITYGNINATELADYTSGCNLGDGAVQRFTAQEPVPFSFTFQGKAGDKVSFEVNCDSLAYTDNSANARSGWARTFLPQLDVVSVDQETAEAADNFVDPYGLEGQEAVETMADSLAALYEELAPQTGSGAGEWPSDAVDAFLAALDAATLACANDEVNNMNVQVYLDALEEAWSVFLAARNLVDWDAEGNYRLFYTEDSVLVADTEALEANDGAPWSFESYVLSTQSYTPFTTYDGSNSNHSTCNTWYGLGTWLFIGEDGTIHPSTTQAPSVLFTAPASAVYHVQSTFHRTQFNSSASVQLYMHARFLSADSTSVEQNNYIFSTPFGYPSDSYSDPAELDFYVNLHEGDRVVLELDCYTDGKNSSALCMFDNLTVSSRTYGVSDLLSVDDVPSDADFYNAYASGDKTTLQALRDSAATLLSEHQSQIGDSEGQYPTSLAADLQAAVDAADVVLADAEAITLNIGIQEKALEEAIAAFVDGRLPYEFLIRGVHGIRQAGTDLHLTRKNLASAGTHYYAEWANEATVMADITKQDADSTDYSWLFLFSEWDYSTLSEEEVDSTAIGSTRVTPADDVEAYLANGYFVRGSPSAANTDYNLRFYKVEDTDSVFCVKRMDGTYWASGSMTWDGSKNDINSSATPVYAFVVDDTYLTGSSHPTSIGNLAATGSEAQVKSVRYYNLQGQAVRSTTRGILLRRSLLSDGTMRTEKILIR